ncbi:MAG: SpoIIE family protein phosphatase [Deltaproteobacteria bacterium]|jgi:sigma-B regulation protein RsbU (phosphoserine phosphatase)|nr:SpoIIE family protein phosphatase [Deltaproteobacteria bacterium]
METMPPVALGVILSLSFLVIVLLRKPFEKYFVRPAVETAQPRRQFAVDLTLCLLAGVLGNAANMISFGFPVYSGMPLIIGCLIAGFFIALDTALARERFVIQEAVARNNVLPPPARLYSMTKKFSLVALTVTVFISLVFALVFSRDIVWLSQIDQNEASLVQAQVSVAYEVGFILVVVLALVVNLIISYSRNLKFLFQNETRILERVTHGDLSKKVPVATHDEFGIIAGHTNSMIDGLRHRTELMTSLKLAEEVQHNLLPQQPPDFPGADVAGTSIYCDETGGDYYDYFKLPGDRLGVVVADASGHGVGAAMHMTTVRAFLHYGLRDYQGPGKLLNEVNQYVTRDSFETSRFMSLFLLEIDPSTRTLRWVRAGHEPAIIFDPADGEFRELSGAGIAPGRCGGLRL